MKFSHFKLTTKVLTASTFLFAGISFSGLNLIYAQDSNVNLGVLKENSSLREIASNTKRKKSKKIKKANLKKQKSNLSGSRSESSKNIQSKAPINDYRTKEEILAEMRRIQVPDSHPMTQQNPSVRPGSPRISESKVEKMTLGGAVLDSESRISHKKGIRSESESLSFNATTPIMYNPRITDRMAFELTPEKQTNLSLGCGHLSLLGTSKSQSREVEINGAFSVCEIGAVMSLPLDLFVRTGVDFIQGDYRMRDYNNSDLTYVDSKLKTSSLRDPEVGLGYQYLGEDVSSIFSLDVAISLGPKKTSSRSDGMGSLVDSEENAQRGGFVYIPSLSVFSSSAYPVRYGARVSYLISGKVQNEQEQFDINGGLEFKDKEFQSGGNILVPTLFVEMPMSAHRVGFSASYVNREDSRSRTESSQPSAMNFEVSESAEKSNQDAAGLVSGAIYGELKFTNAFSVLPLFEYSRVVRSETPAGNSSRGEIFSGQLNLKASF